ncbi:hypothetical protein [uncultured Gammaproteobacteria bacterium]|uniref:hypothetical protein n=1 Tax=thiotrophic endosymbiont of Bathymodiolus puteoserpentis (Logatchev) TaxID=343240 RepID=UPI0010BA7B70|nr:hypothetical protein [thiotrophic endosymbiont of Bathymodiolus puteoserpentis (Logatchev)]CAC9430667.1 hypothetical protein [uncultured Gammaproteobacteria bacterium]CAC9432327.1 hypothetical protein [uncultured Gammaproteobacteria bacterium]CAC9629933.1 hypothetical protein [uncultured Gammaproteobacteria bacterium]CAC9639395.1 hypothetical protein [uncultured Gammaproteobacteria bacterium]CAC9648745.1 hypothetical protein [uncultured Gammaproteobacteria bacterium]
MTFAFQKVNTTDLVLKDWKRYLDPTEKAIFESELSDYAWYSVVENNKVIAVFQIINVLDQYSKNLKIIFHPDFKEDESDIVGIILFIYKSMLDICDEKKIKKLKLYIDNLLIHSIFMVIATHQADNQDIMKVENYSKWIEIHMH